MTTIAIPRTLADQLLRRAVSAGDRGARGRIRHSGGSLRCEPMTEIDGETFALWLAHPSRTPTPADWPALPARADLLFLGISLETKGVLQMRGWSWDGNAWREQPVEIFEDRP
ncbi:MAG TPA: hypothetical protein VNL72_04470 [Gammaproteobacteria bacterium]|nr:hypothetical protein [Gammaproteobacteria bacterium]